MNNQQNIWFPFQDAFERFTINPMTNWQRFFNPQFFINYNAGDVEAENNVLQQVGSYGKQLGKIINVLDVLVARLPQDQLTPQERRTLDEFRDLSEKVSAAVAAVKGPREQGITQANIDRMIESLQSMARSDPAAHRYLIDRLKGAIAAEDMSKAADEGSPAP
jgi:hypothetical protein